MALAVSEPTTEATDNSDGTSYAPLTAYTPTANALQVVFVFAAGTTAAGTMTGGSLTWTRRGSKASGAGSTLYVFTAQAGGSPASCDPTFDCTGDGSTGVVMCAFEVTGHNQTTPFVQAGDGAASAANPVATFASNLNTNNCYFGAVGVNRTAPAYTPPGSFTETCDTGHTTPNSGMQACYRIGGETGTTLTWTGASGNYACLAIEIALDDPNKTVNVSVLGVTASLPSSTLSNTFTASALSATAALQTSAPTVAIPPAALSITSSTVAPALSSALEPATLSASASLPASTPVVSVPVGVLTVSSSLQGPGYSASFTPSALSAVANLLTPGLDVIVSPGVLSAIANLLDPSISTGGGNVTFSASVLSAASALIAPGLSVQPEIAVLAVTSALQAQALAVSLAPSALSASASTQSPSLVVLASPGVLSASSSLPTPTAALVMLPDALTSTAILISLEELETVVSASALSASASLVAPGLELGDPQPLEIWPSADRTFSADADPKSSSIIGGSRTYETEAKRQESPLPGKVRVFIKTSADEH